MTLSLTPVNVLSREKQLGVVRELTDIVSTAANDQSLKERTWCLSLSLLKEAGKMGHRAYDLHVTSLLTIWN